MIHPRLASPQGLYLIKIPSGLESTLPEGLSPAFLALFLARIFLCACIFFFAGAALAANFALVPPTTFLITLWEAFGASACLGGRPGPRRGASEPAP